MAAIDPGFSNSFNPINTQQNSSPYNNGTPLNIPSAGSGGTPMGPQQFDNGTPLKMPGAGTGNPAMGPFQSNDPRAQQNPQVAAQNGGPDRSFYGGPNWTPTYQQNAGYNPSQHASQGTANSLAQGLGANVMQTQNAPGSPIGPPPQQMLDFGGADMLNAGLMAERYKKYDHATADRMTRDELALGGPRQAPNEDSQGGSMGSWSQYGASPGGLQNAGGGQNIGQFIGERAGAAFGTQGAGGAYTHVPQGPQVPQFGNPGGSYGGNPGGGQGYAASTPPYPTTYPGQGQYGGGGYGGGGYQAPQFSQTRNSGGFGPSQNFAQANQGSQVQQLLAMLFGGGGQGGGMNFQSRGRSPQFGGGMSPNFAGMMNSRQQAPAMNPYANNANYGGGANRASYYEKGYDPRGSVPMGSYSDNRNMILSNQ